MWRAVTLMLKRNKPVSELFRNAQEAVDDIASATSLEGLYTLLGRTFEAFDFEHFMISDVPSTSERVDLSVMLTNWPDGWYAMYERVKFVMADPVVEMCRRTTRPFTWSEAPIDPENKRSRRVMELAQDFGLSNGFCLPVHEPDGGLACVSLGGRREDIDEGTKATLHFVAMSAFYQARKLTTPPPARVEVNPLTVREREVLTWAAAGKFHEQIGEILGITERTVTAHVVSATAKLGAANKTQAVVKAMQARFIRV